MKTDYSAIYISIYIYIYIYISIYYFFEQQYHQNFFVVGERNIHTSQHLQHNQVRIESS